MWKKKPNPWLGWCKERYLKGWAMIKKMNLGGGHAVFHHKVGCHAGRRSGCFIMLSWWWYVFVFVYLYLCICICVFVYLLLCICVFVFVYFYLWICICVFVFVCLCIVYSIQFQERVPVIASTLTHYFRNRAVNTSVLPCATSQDTAWAAFYWSTRHTQKQIHNFTNTNLTGHCMSHVLLTLVST